MKAVSKLAVLLTLGVFVPFASAKSPESSYLETCLKGPNVPVPVAVVSPSVSSDFVGSSVELEFVVDTKGLPTQIVVKSSPDDTLSTAVVEAVKKWRFTPAMPNGSPVATKVVLPVKIIDTSVVGPRFAVN